MCRHGEGSGKSEGEEGPAHDTEGIPDQLTHQQELQDSSVQVGHANLSFAGHL